MGSPLLGACLWVLCHLLSHLPPAEGAKTMSCGPHSCSTQSCCLAQARDPNGTRGVCGCPPGMTPTLQNTTIICQAPPCTVPTLEEARSKCRDPQGALGNRSCIQKYLTAKCAEPTEEDLKKVLPQLKAGAGAGPEGTAALLLSTEALVLQAALGALSRNASANASVIPLFFSTPIMEVSASGVSSCDAPTLELRAGGQRLALACGAVLGSGSSAALALIAYRGEVVLTGGGRRRLNSRLVGAAVEKRDGPFRGSVNVTLQHLAALEAGEEPFCVFWQMVGTEGGWNRSGCTRVEGDAQHSVCSCTHLSTFAILVALHPVAETFALTVVTYVGMSVSLLCLFLAIVTFMLCRSLWSVSVTLHLHLSICLFAAHLLFLVAVTRTANRLMCAITAGFLHYLFLACFAWMFLEGLHLFLTVRNLRVLNYGSAGRFRRGYIYLVGYGVPAIVVGVSAAAYPRGYGTTAYCWLSIEKGFVWSFLGPICLIILVNLLFFLITLWTLRDRLSSLNADITAIKNTRVMTFKALAHVCILGCTWGLGLLQAQGDNTVVAFLFTIFNSTQGAFIFLVHCLLNRQVMDQYRHWFRALGRRVHPQETPTSEIQITYVTEGEKVHSQSTEGCTWEK